ncbi:hypothetical protein AB4559_23540, partial [Vibrio sp. 10N.222.51.C8]|uniref:hypothetical protein n=1 Tax=Vibrio sp. 10N.222.51.C8 TaxID=3229624 RepID=UPI00354C5910
MNIIINASNLRVGGALQVALSTIEELHRFPQHIFHVFLSPAFEGLIDYDMSEKSNINFYSVEFPSRFTILGNVKQLDNLEMKIGADCVFSIFGPTYWKPKSPHLAGFAQGYYLYRNLPFFDTIGLFEKVKLFLLSSYHGFLLKKHVDEFVVETYDVKSRLMSFLNINESSIHVATNTYSTYFKDFNKGLFVRGEPAGDTKIFRLLTIAYPYPHKNLEILKKVSDILNKDTIGFH